MPCDDDNELKRLRRELQEVTAERDRLLTENRRLRHEFGSPQKQNAEDRSSSISTTLSHPAANPAGINHDLPQSRLHPGN